MTLKIIVLFILIFVVVSVIIIQFEESKIPSGVSLHDLSHNDDSIKYTRPKDQYIMPKQNSSQYQ